jgi:hypothetical protein
MEEMVGLERDTQYVAYDSFGHFALLEKGVDTSGRSSWITFPLRNEPMFVTTRISRTETVGIVTEVTVTATASYHGVASLQVDSAEIDLERIIVRKRQVVTAGDWINATNLQLVKSVTL